jgi:hypothetical protein
MGVIPWKPQIPTSPEHAMVLAAKVLGVHVVVFIAKDVHNARGLNACMSKAESKIAEAVAASGVAPERVDVGLSDF